MGFFQEFFNSGKAKNLSPVPLKEQIDFISSIIHRQNLLGLVHMQVDGLVQMEQLYGYSDYHQAITVLRNTLDQVKPFAERGKKLQIFAQNKDQFAIYYALPKGTDVQMLENLEMISEDLRAQTLELANRTLGRVLEKPIGLYMGWALIQPNPTQTMDRLIQTASKKAAAMASLCQNRGSLILSSSQPTGHFHVKAGSQIWESIALSVCNCVSDGLLILDNKGLVQSVNPAFAQITGYAHEDIYEKFIWSFIKQQKKPWPENLCDCHWWEDEVLFQQKNGACISATLKVRELLGLRAEKRLFVGLLSDISEQKAIEEKIQHQALHDHLTGLPNRVLYMERLIQALRHGERTGERLAVLFLDLDGFKKINDTLGHSIGDQLLKQVAGRLKASVRRSDTVARLGGDEFTILLPEILKEENAVTAARKILDAMRKPFVIEGYELSVTTSIGIAIYPEHGQEEELLIKHADTAMYKAKQQGKNSYRVFSALMNATVVQQCG